MYLLTASSRSTQMKALLKLVKWAFFDLRLGFEIEKRPLSQQVDTAATNRTTGKFDLGPLKLLCDADKE